MIKVHENGKVYNVKVRAIYQQTIKSEKRLREVVENSFVAQYGIESANKNSFFTKCDLLGILTYRAPEKR